MQWREIRRQQKVETCVRCLDKDKELAMKESKLTTLQEESSKLHKKIAVMELSMGVKNAEKFPVCHFLVLDDMHMHTSIICT